MRLSEIKIKLAQRPDDKLLAFASITLDDCFVIRDIKVIQGATGIFVAMPSRRVTFHCFKCGAKNHLQANFCCHCGKTLDPNRFLRSNGVRLKLHADIAHPIHSACRNYVQDAIVSRYREELEKAKHPGYLAPSDVDLDEGMARKKGDGPETPKLRQMAVGTSEAPPALSPDPHGPLSSPPEPKKDRGGLGIFG